MTKDSTILMLFGIVKVDTNNTLLKPYKNTAYTVVASQNVNATGDTYHCSTKVRTKTTTAITVYTNCPIMNWLAFGLSS